MKYFVMMLALAASLAVVGCDNKEKAETTTEQKVERADGSEAEVQTSVEVTTETSN